MYNFTFVHFYITRFFIYKNNVIRKTSLDFRPIFSTNFVNLFTYFKPIFVKSLTEGLTALHKL